MSSNPINWNEELRRVDEGTRLIPNGTYNVQVTDAKPVRASTGSDMIKVTVVVTSGPFQGRSLTSNIVFSFEKPQAMKMALRRLGAFGITREYLQAHNPSVAQIASILHGMSAEGEVTSRVWNGDEMNDIDFGRGDSLVPGAVPPPPAPLSPTAIGQPGTPNIPRPAAPAAAPAAPAVATTPADEPADESGEAPDEQPF